MKFFRHPIFIAILILVIANIVIFWKFYFKGLLPFPGDLLVSYYFPWSSGGFAGFDPWTTRKGVVAMDVIRQMYPWKDLVLEQIKNGQWPLWNPFNFSGTPLLANLQSSVFFPGNFIFFFLPKIWAWISLVIGLPLVFSFFSYLFLRSLKLGNIPAVFGAIAISNLASITVWAEQLIVIQSVLFLPLILFLINRYCETKKAFLFWLIAPLLAFSIFGGHPQSAVYVYLITFLYTLYKRISLIKIVTCFTLSLGISAVQLIPSFELYTFSARETILQKQFILNTALPWNHLAMIFAPDYFGNPATFNFRGLNYDNFQPYFGLVALLLALYGAFRKEARFFTILAVFGLLFALSPLAYISVWLSVPILSSGFLSRIIFIFGFAMVTLSVYGFDHLSKNNSKIPVIFVTLAFLLLGVTSFIFTGPEQLISLRNMLIPVVTFICASLIVLKFKKLTFLLIAVAILEYAYFFNKYQPFSPQKFIFPNHPVFDFLQTTDIDRYFGVDRAYIDSNFATYYRVYTPEGYDPLYIKNYGDLLAFPKPPSPSDAFVQNTNSEYRNKLFDILGVKYLIDKTDEPDKDFGPNNDRFPTDKYTFIKQINKWKYYERKTALPRVFLSGSYLLETDPKKIIETFYSPTFDPKTILLSEKPLVEPFPDKQGETLITAYSPNKVVINTQSLTPKLLFLSDNFYPGWKATVDGTETPILRADYTFRAVSVPTGEHQVVFTYDPLSFKLGIAISVCSLLSLLLISKFKK